ncbi:hypothetical protein [Levilactobacillus angrenensis]|uniref:Uncharacterized protein n=1 Tax=Levilactobacillus angrenensis TaxID=2486020 RepID=A0ABW1UDK2_9LACO|nr:hypothetical protein [Levilactobacillus angrenensis]
MSKTVPVYVSIDADNSTLNEQPKSVSADGLTELWIRPGMLNYLLENWTKYLVIDGQFKRTSDDFADLSVDHLLHVIDVVNGQLTTATDTISTMDSQLTAANATITQLQQMLIQSSQAQAESAADQTQMKQMLVQMSKVMAQSQAATTE